MTKTIQHLLTVFLLLFLLFLIPAQANYYQELSSIDRKIYVAVTQQGMLEKKMAVEKRKMFNGAMVRAYKKAIKKKRKDEIRYRNDKKKIQKKIWQQEAREERMVANLSSIPGNIRIYVNKSRQTMKVYKGKVLIYDWLCSTGKKGYTTPSGNYNPYYTVKMHYSRKWDMSPMPYSTFYYKGFAIHGTSYTRWLGRRASHGCIRLSTRNAKKIYHLARKYGHKRVRIQVV